MPKHTILCSLILITLFIPLDTVLGFNPESFYGTNSLKPSVDKDTITILLPGGTKSLVNNNNNTTYLTNDHIGSVRLALNTDNTIEETIEYSPFGDGSPENDLTFGYTGMEYDNEIDTYDYHARGYDPSVGRFVSVDLKREGGSPYVYVGNNPVNFVDPDGRGRIIFWFYPEKLPVEYATNVGSILVQEAKVANNSFFPERFNYISAPTPSVNRFYNNPNPSGPHHITIDVTNEMVPYGPRNEASGRFFGDFFAQKFKEAYSSKVAGEVGSVLLNGCATACGEEENSFAKSFYLTLKRNGFDNLEHVWGANFGITTYLDIDNQGLRLMPPGLDLGIISLEIDKITDENGAGLLKIKDYYQGILTDYLTKENFIDNHPFFSDVAKPFRPPDSPPRQPNLQHARSKTPSSDIVLPTTGRRSLSSPLTARRPLDLIPRRPPPPPPTIPE